MNRRRGKQMGGFTLLESLFAALLIGLVIAALVASNTAFTMANAAGVDLSTAEFLIEEIRERTATMTFDDIAVVSEKQYSPPIDMEGHALNDFDAFTQKLSVRPVSSTDFDSYDSLSDFKKIVVKIHKNNRLISQASWVRANLD